MSAINIFSKIDDQYVVKLDEFSRIITLAQSNSIAIYSIFGDKTVKNNILFDFFRNYLIKSEEYLTNLESYTWPLIDDNIPSIWMWSEPFEKKLESGGTVSIFLLNCKCCSSGVSPFQDNAMVLTLTTLLSSVMILNLKEFIAENSLQFIRHSTSYAKYELNEEQAFQKLIFVVQGFYYGKQDLPDFECLDYGFGLHDDKSPDWDDLNFKIDVLDPQKHHSIDQKFVRQSLGSTFEEIIVCLMSSNLKQFPEDIELFRRTCDTDKITVKMISGHPITAIKLIDLMKEWWDVLKSYDSPKNKSPHLMTDQFCNQMAINSAIDYYYYNMKSNLSNNKDLDFQKDNLKITGECVELFDSFKLFGGEKSKIQTKVRFSQALNENQNYFHELLSEKLVIHENRCNLNDCPKVEEIIQKLKTIEELKAMFSVIKCENHEYKHQFENQLKHFLSDTQEIKKQIHTFKEFSQNKAKEDGLATTVVKGIADFVGDVVPMSRLWIKLAKLVYNTATNLWESH